MTTWDGVERRERRETDRAAAASRPPDDGGIHPRAVVAGVALATILALQVGTLVNQEHLGDQHAHELEFRRRLTCFVVGIMGDTPRPQILTDCGFIDVGVPE